MITPPSEKKLFLVDAYALIFRAYYAFIKNPRINTKGMNTSAVFGFTNALLEVIRSEQPTHLAVVFDPPGPTLRNEQFEDYKANRDETPEDIKLSVPWIVKILEGMRIPVLQAPGFEADDLIGCLAKRAEKEGFDVFMMTPDKDFAQLVTDKIQMFRPGRGGNPASVWGPEEVRERYGLEDPKQVIDLLGLMGDSADNIPGIPGVGEKTAIKFLQAYGSMEGLYEHVHELKGKMKEKVEANREMAFLSRELATIVLDIDFDEDFPAMALEPANVEMLAPVLEELEFRTLSRRILGDVSPSAAAPGASANPAPRPASNSQDSEGQLSMFDAAMDVAPAISTLAALDADKVKYDLVDAAAGMKALVKTLTQAKRFAFDTETSGLNAMEASLVGMSFSAEAHTGSYVPVNPDTWPAIRDIFKPLLEDPKLTIVGQNLKYDGKIMARHGVDLSQANLEDTMVAHYLLEPDQPHGMDALAQAFLDYQCIPITDLLGKKARTKSPWPTFHPPRW